MMRAALLNCFVVIVSAAGADEERAGGGGCTWQRGKLEASISSHSLILIRDSVCTYVQGMRWARARTK